MVIVDAQEFLKHNIMGCWWRRARRFRLQCPMIINSKIEPPTIYTAAAPESTLRYLFYMPSKEDQRLFFRRPALFKSGGNERARSLNSIGSLDVNDGDDFPPHSKSLEYT